MKKIILLLTFCATMLVAKAIPACPTPVAVSQPDGQTLTIVLHGDEFYHFTTTTDGYTVLKNQAGYYVYAQKATGGIVTSDMIAHDVKKRTANETAFLAKTDKFITDNGEAKVARASKAKRNNAIKKSPITDYGKFRGLVVLVNFSDRKFTRTDANQFYDHMLNDERYKGYANEDGTPNYYGNLYLGSVRDYFFDSSNGIFDPHFDVVGPIDVDMECDSVLSTKYAPHLFYRALTLANPNVDYSKYDTDGDGDVDMVYFIVAGYGANYGGNNRNYLWPHASSLANWKLKLDNTMIGRYACSTELYGWESQNKTIIDGIGTICHEFSHVLGLPDLYDTDYEGSGGESQDPGEWDIMAGASYKSYGRKPAGYSAWERFACGFSSPKMIDHEGKYTLNPLQQSNESYIMKTATENEYFIFENRQPTGWDAKLPGHGMLVSHIDSTDNSIWDYNSLNVDPSHNCYIILRAGGNTGSANGSDPFPGTAQISNLSNTSTPNLRSWGGGLSKYNLASITESDGVISFEVKEDKSSITIIEDFEMMPVTTNLKETGLQGNFTKWDFVNSKVISPQDLNSSEAGHVTALKNPGAVSTTEDINVNPFIVSAKVYNQTNSIAGYRLFFLNNTVQTWTIAGTDVLVNAHESADVSWNVNVKGPVKFRIQQISGSKTAYTYIDDIGFQIVPLQGDVDLNGTVDVSDVTALINMVLGTVPAYRPIGDLNNDDVVNVSDVTELINVVLGAN